MQTTLLVDDGVDRDRRLARLAVANDQFALASADRNHRVDRFDARLHGLFDALPVHDARGEPLYSKVIFGFDRTLTVDRVAESVDDAANEALSNGH
jgi:hypothetical protein